MNEIKSEAGISPVLSTDELEPARWRPEVVAFADAMEAKLRDNDDKGGWQDCAPHWLMMRVIQEACELLDELDPGRRAAAQFYAASRMLSAACDELDQFGPHLKTKGDPQRVLCEAVDVANFAMMVADRIAGLTRSRRQTTNNLSTKAGLRRGNKYE